MKDSKIKKLRKSYGSGHPDIRLDKAEEAKMLLIQNIGRLRDGLDDQKFKFRRALESWHGIRINELRRPQAIHEDVHTAWKVSLFASVLALAELALAYFLARLFDIPILFAMMIAIVAMVTTEVGLHALWLNKQQPRENIRRLRWYIIAPSLVVALIALAVLLMARSLSPVFSDDVLNISLFALSIGTLVFAAGLFGFAYVYFWSRRAEKKYDETERQLARSAAELRRVEKIISSLNNGEDGDPPSSPATSDSKRMLTTKIGSAASIALLAASITLTTACAEKSPTPAITATPSAQTAPVPKPGQSASETQIEVYVDWSLSLDLKPLDDATTKVMSELPDIVERFHVSRFSGYRFDSDGWNASQLFTVDLPIPDKGENSEASTLYGRRKTDKQADILKGYREGIRAGLSQINKAKLLPPPDWPQVSCTDINGVIMRILSSNSATRQIEILISDGGENCETELRSRTPPPTPNTVLIIILVSEKPKKGETSSQQFEARKAKLLKALPWAHVVAPHNDLSAAIGTELGTDGRNTIANAR